MIPADQVKRTIAGHLLADGMDIVIDFDKSTGSWLIDKRNGDRYLDCFAMFASMSVGFNHPGLLAIQNQLGRLAVQKPANSDAYSEPMAEFIETFGKYAMPDYLPRAFFIEGGALAVENCLKAAFDWKVKKNFGHGSSEEKGHQIIHFQQAFHGRSGYTLSLTNTADPRKTAYFPKFSWPRITNPKITFPLDAENLSQVIALENQATGEIDSWLQQAGNDIAAIIIEPIQGEGGDNHFRPEFLQALRKICDENELLLIFDEVQTGVGLTGTYWAHQHFGVVPDLMAFGKKTQVCGFMAGPRLDEVKDNVMREPSRINSTFGGNLVDMVRCSAILKIIDRENLVENARKRGEELCQGLQDLVYEFPQLVSNARGRGLMCAFDLVDKTRRDQLQKRLYSAKLLVVGCGVRSIRFRPHLVISREEIQQLLAILRNELKMM